MLTNQMMGKGDSELGGWCMAYFWKKLLHFDTHSDDGNLM